VKVIKTELMDVFIIEPTVFGDERGWFMESWSSKKMESECFFYSFVQDNHSFSSEKGIIRGLHFQLGCAAQAKLVRCCSGAVIDVVVDLREGSPTYKKHIKVKLSSKNKRQLLIPKGFAHGFLTLTENVEFLYKTDNFYSAEFDRSIAWNDPEIGIDWGIKTPILSEKDEKAPNLSESDVNFVYNTIAK